MNSLISGLSFHRVEYSLEGPIVNGTQTYHCRREIEVGFTDIKLHKRRDTLLIPSMEMKKNAYCRPDMTFVKFLGCLFCQVLEMNCALFPADLFLYTYRSEF